MCSRPSISRRRDELVGPRERPEEVGGAARLVSHLAPHELPHVRMLRRQADGMAEVRRRAADASPDDSAHSTRRARASASRADDADRQPGSRPRSRRRSRRGGRVPRAGPDRTERPAAASRPERGGARRAGRRRSSSRLERRSRSDDVLLVVHVADGRVVRRAAHHGRSARARPSSRVEPDVVRRATADRARRRSSSSARGRSSTGLPPTRSVSPATTRPDATLLAPIRSCSETSPAHRRPTVLGGPDRRVLAGVRRALGPCRRTCAARPGARRAHRPAPTQSVHVGRAPLEHAPAQPDAAVASAATVIVERARVAMRDAGQRVRLLEPVRRVDVDALRDRRRRAASPARSPSRKLVTASSTDDRLGRVAEDDEPRADRGQGERPCHDRDGESPPRDMAR